MNNLRKFSTLEDYEEAELVKPAVSLIAEDDTVFFDQKEAEPEAFGGLTVIYNVDNEDVDAEVQIFNGGGGSSESESESGGGSALPSRMIVDGNEETPVNSWRFETAGEHTVQYEFEDNTVPAGFLAGNAMATSIIVGDDIEVIAGTEGGSGAFDGCGNIDTVEVGTGITEIGNYAFNNCMSMTIFSIGAYTPPTLGTDVFAGHSNDLVIYVPNGEGDSYKYSSGWSDYASCIEENV